jgi:hypothetical protein
MMEMAYELLRTTLPFRTWKLPDPDGIVFRVTADPSEHAHFGVMDNKDKHPLIGVNQKRNKSLDALLLNMAHEMCHLRQWQLKLPVNHGNRFQLLKARVCKEHGFDPGVF